MTPYFDYRREPDALVVSLRDDWTIDNVKVLRESLQQINASGTQQVIFQCGGLRNMDLSGAWVLYRRSRDFESEGRTTEFHNFKAAHFKFLKNIQDVHDAANAHAPSDASAPGRVISLVEVLARVGRGAMGRLEDIGRMTRMTIDGLSRPSYLALSETLRQVEQTGAGAVAIVALVAFLMGLVLAYQGANQLEQFGAQIFVADLVTIAMLREMGALLAGILAAGRTGSAFAAAIGVMKLNEEVDALKVMGLNPNQILVAPRVVALLISLPILTVLAMLAGICGGLTLSTLALDMSVAQYLDRTADAADLNDFLVGFVKAPVFALLIAGVATLRGMQVSTSADQLGRLTTTAVVQSIFLIILADAVFTVVFSRLDI